MRRITKVLLPLYKAQEMDSELEEEWIVDSRSQPDMSFQLLTKTLFRIAHQWCTNIDIDEYIDLLTRVYDRIIYYTQVVTNERTFTLNPLITVSFPAGETKAKESGGKLEV